MDQIRCPFCVEGNEFKVMVSRGAHMFCGRCGHVVVPGLPTFECSCPKCKELNHVVGSGPRQEFWGQ